MSIFHQSSWLPTLLPHWAGIKKMQLDNGLPIMFPILRVFQCIPRHQLESEGIKASEYPCLQAVFVPAHLWICRDAF